MLAGTAVRLAVLGQGAEALRPTSLVHSPLLLLEEGHCLTDQALEVCGRGRGHAQIDMGASSLGTLSRLVAAGFGLTLMPEIAAATEVRFEKLAEVLETVGAALIALARAEVPDAAVATRPAPQTAQADIYRDTH